MVSLCHKYMHGEYEQSEQCLWHTRWVRLSGVALAPHHSELQNNKKTVSDLARTLINRFDILFSYTF